MVNPENTKIKVRFVILIGNREICPSVHSLRRELSRTINSEIESGSRHVNCTVLDWGICSHGVFARSFIPKQSPGFSTLEIVSCLYSHPKFHSFENKKVPLRKSGTSFVIGEKTSRHLKIKGIQ